MNSYLPRVEISLSKIEDNARILSQRYSQRGISLMGVSKAVLGEPSIIRAMIKGGVQYIADSRIENIQKMQHAGIETQYVLLRTPPSHAELVVRHADISLNTEIDTLKKLSFHAQAQNKKHGVLIMVEGGDLREGVLPSDLPQFFKEMLLLPNLDIMGIGCNLTCYGGIKPDNTNMQELSKMVRVIENEFHISLGIISGGNSANHEWFTETDCVDRINNLRLGESILLGRETVNRNAIPELHTEAFKLITEVIESKEKPSLPYGTICQDAFGNTPSFLDSGIHRRAIISLGRQDILVSGLKCDDTIEILGASSDHIILHDKKAVLSVGDEVSFGLNYGALLAVMTSLFTKTQFI